jgi:hypothetical protein
MNVTSTTAQLSRRQRFCLQFLSDVYEVSSALATRTYLWGGMVIDILCGAFLREHHDLDGFTLNLLDVKAEMAAMFSERGYTTSYSEEFDYLRVERGALHAVFNRLEIVGGLAMWRHVGDQGTVYFPADWLALTPRSFYGVPVYISGVRFEYAIKAHSRLLNPEWALRDKDQRAIQFLSAELARRGLDENQLLSRIWSYTPYWVERDFPEYARPIVVASSTVCRVSLPISDLPIVE